MIKLVQFPPAFGLPNASPFCMKLETYLRMAGLPFELNNKGDVMKAPKGKLLDAPAGAGQIVDAARLIGFDAIGADINKERSDFVFADFNQSLPFADDEFRVLTSLEGIEHVFFQKNNRWIEPQGLRGHQQQTCLFGGRHHHSCFAACRR